VSEQGYKVLLEKASIIRKWSDNRKYRERFRKVISKSISPEKLFSSLPETYSDSSEVHIATITNFMFPPERQAISKYDRLQAAYCLLTILHDKIYEYDSWVTPISVDIWSLDAEWIEALWEQMKKGSTAVASGDAEFFYKIDFALKLVEADLLEKAAEIDRNKASSKVSRIGALLWNLYEKSLKVIVDSFLERVWPK
jgi:hypothetical protein